MSEEIRGGIRPLEMRAFRHHLRPGDMLKCRRPEWMDDEEKELTMTVIGAYPHILEMEYKGRNNRRQSTSMTWAEAILLNRMTQWELDAEIKRMKQEYGIPYRKDQMKVHSKRHRIDRKEYVPLIVRYREGGMTYARIAILVGISASLVRDIYLKEGANQDV